MARLFPLLWLSWAACEPVLEGPTPVVSGVEPSLVCTEVDTEITVTGQAFAPVPTDALTDVALEIPGITLTVRTALEDGQGAFEVDEAWASADVMRFTVGASLGLTAGTYDVTVENPDGQRSTLEGALGAVGAPSITGFSPDPTCGDGAPATVTAEGVNFVTVGSALPSVQVDGNAVTVDSVAGCVALGAGDASVCTSVTFTVPGGAPLGPHDVTLTNPSPAACATATPATLTIAPPPVLAAAVPDAACGAVAGLQLTGNGFRPDSTVTIDGLEPDAVSVVDPTTIDVSVVSLSLGLGEHEVVVSTPDGCDSNPVTFTVGGAPDVISVAPDETCDAGAQITVSGAGFASGDVVTIDGVDADTAFVDASTLEVDLASVVLIPGDHAVAVRSAGGCTSNDVTFTLGGPPDVVSVAPDQTCDAGAQITVSGAGFASGDVVTIDGVDADTTFGDASTLQADLASVALAPGAHAVAVRSVDGCTSDEVTFTLDPAPTIADVSPGTVCDTGNVLTITGTGFVSGMSATLDGVPALSVSFVSSTQITADFGPTGLGQGAHDLAITTPDGCGATALAAVTIPAAPALLGVDPSNVYGGVDTPVVVYTSGLSQVDRVWIAPVGGGAETDLAFDGLDPSAIQAIVASGLAQGDYDVFVEDGTLPCPAVLLGALHVQNDLTVSVGGVTPDHLFVEIATLVQVSLSLPLQVGDVPFQDVPDVFLVPSSSADPLLRLVNVRFDSLSQLTLRVPASLVVDVYDLLIVNPDGSAALVPDAITITDEGPPRVNTATPPSVPIGGGQTVVFRGFDFRAPAVTLTCRDSVTGVDSVAAASVLSSTPLQVTVSVPTDALGVGVCLVHIENGDGTMLDWPSLAIVDGAQPVAAWEAGASMTTARRAPAAAVLRATTAERFLYALGGDDGTNAGAMASVEYAPIDVFGDLGAWRPHVRDLPMPLTRAGVARFGRFLYLVGGNDGVGPVDTVLRAQVLDPIASPQYDFHSVEVDPGSTLEQGRWNYRVSAIYDDADLYNPGETLASEPIIIHAPGQAAVALTWTEEIGAIGYRVYRTPTPDAPSGTEVLLAEVAGGQFTFVDDGALPPGVGLPLPMGSLSEWSTLPSLPVALESPAVTLGMDPLDPAFGYVYAAGGSDGAATSSAIYALDVIEFEAGIQDYGVWLESVEVLPAAVTEASAWSADAFGHPVIPSGEGFLYVGGGRTTPGGAATGLLSIAEVLPTGALGPLTSSVALSPGRAGFGAASGSGRVHAFTGSGAAPSTDGYSANVGAAGGLTAISGPPPTTAPRYLSGSAQEAGVYYLVGGDDGSGATVTIDQSQL